MDVRTDVASPVPQPAGASRVPVASNHAYNRYAPPPSSALLTVMLANNETGVLQPVAELAALAPAGTVVHTDAVPPILALDGKPPIACYYGTEDASDSGCTDPKLPSFVTVYKKAGSHHFDENYEQLATELIDRMPGGPAPSSTSP